MTFWAGVGASSGCASRGGANRGIARSIVDLRRRNERRFDCL